MVTSPSPRPRVVIIGPPGSGKSTVGQSLAALLEADFHDTDHAVESVAGQSISDIFVTQGEPAFRALERAAVRSALAEQRGVVALGGGAPMDVQSQQALAGHTVVFLDVGIADAARRIGLDGSRPLLAVNPRATWIAMMKDRRATYERLATVRVDTAGRGAAAVAQEIADWLGEQR